MMFFMSTLIAKWKRFLNFVAEYHRTTKDENIQDHNVHIVFYQIKPTEK